MAPVAPWEWRATEKGQNLKPGACDRAACRRRKRSVKRVSRCTNVAAVLAFTGLAYWSWSKDVNCTNLEALETSFLALMRQIDSDEQSLRWLLGELSKQQRLLWEKSLVASAIKASQKSRQAVDAAGLPRFLPAAITPIPFAALAFVIGGPWLCAIAGGVLLAASTIAFYFPADASLQVLRQTADRELDNQQTAWGQSVASVDAMQTRVTQMRLQAKQVVSEIEAARESQEHRCQRLFQQRWKEMRGEQFEGYLAEVFVVLGYEVEQTGKSGDQGVDLIAHRKGRRIAIQAKGYVDSVGNAAVQQAFTGKSVYGCHACAVVTNSRFTASAIAAAQATKCALVHEDNFEDFVFGRVSFD